MKKSRTSFGEREQGVVIEKFLADGRSLVFEAFVGITASTSTPVVLQLLCTIIELLQMLSYPLNDLKSLPWSSGDHWGLRQLSNWLQFLSLNRLDTRVDHVSLR